MFIQSPDNHYSSADNIHVNTTNGVSSGSYTISQPSVTMSQAMLHGLTGSQEFHQQQQPHHYYIQQTDVGGGGGGHSRGGMNQGQLQQQSPHHLPHHNKIPDIVFNGQYYGGKDWFITFYSFFFITFTVESSLFVENQCLWISWVTLAHDFTSPRTYIQVFV